MNATLTSKGQITLPKKLRERLQLSAGDRIEFIVDDDNSTRLLIKRASITRLKGMLPKPRLPVSLEEMQQAIEAGACDS